MKKSGPVLKQLPLDFYLNEDVVELSKKLLGKLLVTNFEGQQCVAKIVETEAYRASDDKACHAYLNKKTKRTETMFMRGGHAYVYLCYGIHHLFNIVTAPKGIAHAVLIRGVEPIENVELMQKRRGFTILKPQLTAGPGVMSKAMGIGMSSNATDLTAANSPIYLANSTFSIPKNQIIASPRVGIAYAEECVTWPWRFRIKDSKWTSKAK